MQREYVRWYSPSLGKDMEMLVFGHSGTPVLVFPSSMGRFFEWEDFNMIDALSYQIEQGFNRVYCVDSVDRESFYNKSVHPTVRMARNSQYESYIVNEVVPYIHQKSGTDYIISTGASFGAYHAANFLFKNPWKFNKLVALGGAFDIKSFVNGYYDTSVYFHNPVDYMYHLHDHQVLERLRHMDLRFITGDHDICKEPNIRIHHLLNDKAVPNQLDVWGDGTGHDWPWWRNMIQKHIQ
jgi:esterase/lipase superfamily enzyme